MWNRFSEPARRAVLNARELAEARGSTYVNTEHLLLGLLKEPSLAILAIFASLGHTVEAIEAATVKRMPRSYPRASRRSVLTPRVKRVIDFAYRESVLMNDNYLGTEHLLMGLICERDGLAARVLASLGISENQCRLAVQKVKNLPEPPAKMSWFQRLLGAR